MVSYPEKDDPRALALSEIVRQFGTIKNHRFFSLDYLYSRLYDAEKDLTENAAHMSGVRFATSYLEEEIGLTDEQHQQLKTAFTLLAG